MCITMRIIINMDKACTFYILYISSIIFSQESDRLSTTYPQNVDIFM